MIPATGTVDLADEVCTNIWLTGAIAAVDAQYSPDADRITSINYVRVRGEKEMRIGVYDPDRPQTTWEFDDTNALMGVHGYMEDDAIKSIGFVMRTTDVSRCPTPPEPLDEPEEEEEVDV